MELNLSKYYPIVFQTRFSVGARSRGFYNIEMMAPHTSSSTRRLVIALVCAERKYFRYIVKILSVVGLALIIPHRIKIPYTV